jgi:tryptophan 2,3-dioxygenase
MDPERPRTYSQYLRVDQLLELQQPLSPGEPDETLFIIIHQVYELWFKEIRHELGRIQSALEQAEPAVASATLKRVLTVLKVLVAQIDVLETMTPVGFVSFRDRLAASSGFQSFQFREIETLLGHRDPDRLDALRLEPQHRERIATLAARPSLWDSLMAYLAGLGHAIPRSVLERDYREPIAADPAVQEVLLGIYREDPALTATCERFVDLDEGLQEWRYRHVKMVERTIGAKPGTGGSEGAEYLKSTLFRPLYPDLWAIRSAL